MLEGEKPPRMSLIFWQIYNGKLTSFFKVMCRKKLICLCSEMKAHMITSLINHASCVYPVWYGLRLYDILFIIKNSDSYV